MSHPTRQQIRAAFEAAASGYDEAAVLQREVAGRLLERLDVLRMQPQRILDLGSGTGYGSRALAARYPKAQVVALDLSTAMLQQVRRRFSRWDRLRGRYALCCGDAAQLPFADAGFDMIFSSLTLQWCADLAAVFAEFRRVLRPGGVVQFATLGPDTLHELRKSWASVDDAVHVNRFSDLHDVGDTMLHAGLAEPVLDMEYLTLTYRDCMGLMRDLKGIGAHNSNPGRPGGLTGKRRLQAMISAYEQFRREDGLLPATYEIVYGHAWRGETRVHGRNGTEEFRFSVDKLQGR